MALHIQDEQGPREIHPAGLRQGACIAVEDVGLQKTNYQGAEKIQRKGFFLWETTARKEDGSPFLILISRTLSTFKESKLRKDVEGLLGRKMSEEEAKTFDWDISGKVGLLNFIHNENDGKTYANVSSMAPLMDGMAAYVPITTAQPDWFKKIVSEARAKAVTVGEAASKTAAPPHGEDDLPF